MEFRWTICVRHSIHLLESLTQPWSEALDCIRNGIDGIKFVQHPYITGKADLPGVIAHSSLFVYIDDCLYDKMCQPVQFTQCEATVYFNSTHF